MHIVLDARLVGVRPGGIATYAQELCAALCAAPDEFAVTVLYGRRGAPLPACPTTRQRRARTPAHHRWERLALGLELLPLRPALVHALDVIPPMLITCPTVITVHDLAFLRWPEQLTADGWRHYGLIHQAVIAAAHIIAVSQATRQDICDLLAVPPARITVVPEAPAPAYRRLSPAERAAAAATVTPEIAELALGRRGPYLLVVGTIEPRKNLPLLLRAYDRLAARSAAAPRLVLAGARGWHADATFATLAALAARDRVDWLDSPSQAELVLLYNGALALAFPSRYEGFGLPALEAFACGTPVLAADTSALREHVAGAGWLLPPDDDAAWSEALATISHDAARRDELASAGRARAAGYSWARTAAATRAVYRQVLGHA